MKHAPLYLVLLLLVWGPGVCAAQDSVAATYEYKMNDNDTLAGARNQCFVKARSLALDKAAQRIADQAGQAVGTVRPLVPALVEVEQASAKVFVSGQDIIFSTTVRSSWDPARVPQALQAIQQDPALQAATKKKETQIAAAPKRVWREVPMAQILTLRAGMDFRQMASAVGEPRSEARCKKKVFYDYGLVWVCFSDNMVKGYIPAGDWKGPCHEYVTFGGEIKYF